MINTFYCSNPSGINCKACKSLTCSSTMYIWLILFINLRPFLQNIEVTYIYSYYLCRNQQKQPFLTHSSSCSQMQCLEIMNIIIIVFRLIPSYKLFNQLFKYSTICTKLTDIICQLYFHVFQPVILLGFILFYSLTIYQMLQICSCFNFT